MIRPRDSTERECAPNIAHISEHAQEVHLLDIQTLQLSWRIVEKSNVIDMGPRYQQRSRQPSTLSALSRSAERSTELNAMNRFSSGAFGRFHPEKKPAELCSLTAGRMKVERFNIGRRWLMRSRQPSTLIVPGRSTG
jgi:hypothetical protein